MGAFKSSPRCPYDTVAADHPTTSSREIEIGLCMHGADPKQARKRGRYLSCGKTIIVATLPFLAMS